MASQSITLFNDAAISEVFAVDNITGKLTSYSGAASTPTLPHTLTITKDAKAMGVMGNDRMVVSAKRAVSMTAAAKVGISSTTLTCSVAKDVASASALVTEAVASMCEIISYFTGAAPSAATVTRVTSFVAGSLL